MTRSGSTEWASRVHRSARSLGKLLGALTLVFTVGSSNGSIAHAAKAEKSRNGVVNINTADAAQLQLLPGVGHAKAQRIIKLRRKRKFKSTYDLVRVRGIGKRTYRRLKPFLTTKGSTTLTRRPAAHHGGKRSTK